MTPEQAYYNALSQDTIGTPFLPQSYGQAYYPTQYGQTQQYGQPSQPNSMNPAKLYKYGKNIYKYGKNVFGSAPLSSGANGLNVGAGGLGIGNPASYTPAAGLISAAPASMGAGSVAGMSPAGAGFGGVASGGTSGLGAAGGLGTAAASYAIPAAMAAIGYHIISSWANGGTNGEPNLGASDYIDAVEGRDVFYDGNKVPVVNGKITDPGSGVVVDLNDKDFIDSQRRKYLNSRINREYRNQTNNGSRAFESYGRPDKAMFAKYRGASKENLNAFSGGMIEDWKNKVENRRIGDLLRGEIKPDWKPSVFSENVFGRNSLPNKSRR